MRSNQLGCVVSGWLSCEFSTRSILYLLPHVLVGTAFFAVARELFPLASELSWMQAVAVLALAHVIGVAAIFAPAGIGVREFVLTMGLANVLAFEQALALAAMRRLLSLAADALIVIMAAAPLLVRRRHLPTR